MNKVKFNRRRFLRIGGSLLAVPTGVALAEPYSLDVTRHDVPTPNLPAALTGLRVAHLTDLHYGRTTPVSILEETVRQANRLAPDLVVMTGDYVDKEWQHAEPLARILARLTPRLGVWACLGNHDYWTSADRVAASLEKIAGVRVLRNAAAEVAPGLWVAGVEDHLDGVPLLRPISDRVPEGAACLFLVHEPPGVSMVEDRPWVALSGHTHGGQVRLAGRALHLPPGMGDFPLSAGWGRFGKARLFVSRGIGNTGLPIRLNCAPELALHSLRPA